jgi:Domain of unknown function (DUF3560)
MNHYEERLERRRERLEKRAQRLRTEGEQRIAGAKRIADIIPFGQPILVGHHSEKRHRRDIDRIHNGFSKGYGALKDAAELERRAESVGSGGISSDDPDAVTKLQEQLEQLQQRQGYMKGVNALMQKAGLFRGSDLSAEERIERVIAQGHDRPGAERLLIDALLAGRFNNVIGFPSFELTNNSANMRRIRQRIEQLRRQESTPPIDAVAGDGWRLFEDVDANRLCIEYDAKPPSEAIAALKAAGFRWSPYEKRWQRHRSNGALWNARHLLGINGSH